MIQTTTTSQDAREAAAAARMAARQAAQTPRITGRELIEKTACKVGVSIAYQGERFDVVRARDNGYGAVELFDFAGTCRGLEFSDSVEILSTFNV